MKAKLSALQSSSVARSEKLFVSLELSDAKWHVAAGDGGTRVSEYTVIAGDGAGLLRIIDRARGHFGLSMDARVVSCYEAGRDGFWLHRFLVAKGIANCVVDAASIEVNRRRRRTKTDRLDARKLLSMLVRFEAGETRVWSVLRVPSVQEEDERRTLRERERLLKERTAHVARIKSLLVLHNVRLQRVGGKHWTQRLRSLDLPPRLRAECEREAKRLALVAVQIAALEAAQARALAKAPLDDPLFRKQRALSQLSGLDRIGPWLLTRELFGWRQFNNRRALAGSVGLGSSPYCSGRLDHDQGISKAGNRRVRIQS
jgi:transposase